MVDLLTYGWNPVVEGHFHPFAVDGCVAGRIVMQKGDFQAITQEGTIRCQPAGRLKFLATGAEQLPAVGDWVAIRRADKSPSGTIVAVLPRKSKFVRRAPGTRTDAQVVAANIDVVYLVSALDAEFNPARIERYLVLAAESGAEPMIVLHKADLSAEVVAEATEIVRNLAPAVPFIITSTVTGDGLEKLRAPLRPGVTGALLGSSGVGKSSIINALLGSEYMQTRSVRESDSRGRHTTTHRELILLPGGGMLIDTPGMREIQLWGKGGGLTETFEDIDAIALDCKFSNCQHDTEPGCAVRKAIEEGRLDEARLANFRKLQRELAYHRGKHDVRERMLTKQEQRKLSVAIKRWKRDTHNGEL